ncbi:MAG TPA: Arc family DNA-binding protein [Dehalococcoidia bacterium]|nr:Arc family DNA-binding protein [Dehalococcoidia bacterium]
MTQAQTRHELDLTPLFQALVTPLGLIDSPERRQEIERYFDAARIHLERAVFDLLDTSLRAINEATPGANVRLQYEAGKPVLVIDPVAATEEASESETEPVFTVEGDMEKVTIRLPRELKDLIDQAANLSGRSANSWYIRHLAWAIRDSIRQTNRGPRRDRGPRWGHQPHGFPGD